MSDRSFDALIEKAEALEKQYTEANTELKSVKEGLEAQTKSIDDIKAEVKTALETIKDNPDNAEALGKADQRMDEMQKSLDELLTASEDVDDGDYSLEKAFVVDKDDPRRAEAKFDMLAPTLGKAITVGTNVPGAAVTALTPVVALQAANFVRQFVAPVQVSGEFRVPTLSGIEFVNQDNTSVKPADNTSLTSATNSLANWFAQAPIPLAVLEDVQGMDAAMTLHLSRKLGKIEAKDAVAAIKGASTSASIKGPSSNAYIVDVGAAFRSMRAELEDDYLDGAEYFVNGDIHTAMLALVGGSSVGAGAPIIYNYNQSTRKYEVAGVPVNRIGAMEAKAANALVGALVNVPYALVLGSGKELTIGRFPQTVPNNLTYAASARSRHAVTDPNAIVRYALTA